MRRKMNSLPKLGKPRGEAFTGLLARTIQRLLKGAGDYRSEFSNCHSGIYRLTVTDPADGQIYRVTVEREFEALEREYEPLSD